MIVLFCIPIESIYHILKQYESWGPKYTVNGIGDVLAIEVSVGGDL